MRLHYTREASTSGPALAQDETILWTSRPHRGAYFLFWLPRGGLAAALWAAGWAFVAYKNGPLWPLHVNAAVPAALASLGLFALLALPVLCLRAHRYHYLLTSKRVIIFDGRSRRSRFVELAGIDRFRIIGSPVGDGVGSLIIEAGTVSGPDGIMPLYVRIVGARDVDSVANLLNERMVDRG